MYIQRGYSEESLRNYFLSAGYSITDINDAIAYTRYVNSVKQQTTKQTSEVQNNAFQGTYEKQDSLNSYVSALISKGFNPEYIKSYLINYGYDYNTVNSVVSNVLASQNQLYNTSAGNAGQIETPSQQKTSHATIIIIFLAIIIISGAFGGIYFFSDIFSSDTTIPENLLDISLEPIETTVKPGEDISFITSISNLGSGNRYDIEIEYSMSDIKTKELIAQKMETVAIETKGSISSKITIPAETPAGKYIIEATAQYGNQNAKANFVFKVGSLSGKPSCFDNIKNQDEQGIDCGGNCESCATCNDRVQNGDEIGVDCGGSCNSCPEPDCYDGVRNGAETGIDCGGSCLAQCRIESCTDGILNQGEEGIDCGGPCTQKCRLENIDLTGLSKMDIIDMAKKASELSPDNAIAICRQLQKINDIENCISTIAIETKNSNYCDLIESNSIKDSCYMQFVAAGDYLVCSRITSPTFAQSCRSLARANEIKTLIDEGREEDIRNMFNFTVNITSGIEVGLRHGPVLNPINTITGTVNEPIFYQVGVTNIDYRRLTFSDDSSKFDIDRTNGVINFVPTSIEEFSTTITVTDGELSDFKIATFRIS